MYIFFIFFHSFFFTFHSFANIFFWSLQQNTTSMITTLICLVPFSVDESLTCCTRSFLFFYCEIYNIGWHFHEENTYWNLIYVCFSNSEEMRWILTFGKTWWLPLTTITTHLRSEVRILLQTCIHFRFLMRRTQINTHR